MARRVQRRQTEVLRIRNKSGRFTKHKSDRDLYYYYYDTKTKKSRPLFVDKKKRPQARRLTARQVKFITAKKVSRHQSRTVNSTKFTIHSRDYIIHQVHKHSKPIMRMLKPHQLKKRITYLYVDVRIVGGVQLRSPLLAVGNKWKRPEVVNAVGYLILDLLRDTNYRMSPKADSQEKRKHVRKADITAAVAEF